MIETNKKVLILSYIKLIITVFIWGGVYHVAKYTVGNADIYTISFVRYLFASIILLIMYFANGKHKTNKFNKAQWTILLWTGFIGIFLYNILFFSAELMLPAVIVAILYACTPCLTVLLNRIIFKYKIKFSAYVGIIVAFCGTIIVIITSQKSASSNMLESHATIIFGRVCAVLASVAMALYNILNRKASNMKIDPLTITTASSVIGAIFLFVTYLFLGEHLSSLLHKTPYFWFSMFYLIIFSTVLCYKWYSDAIKHIGVGQTAIFLNGVPLSAVLIDIFFGDNPINYVVILAGAVIVLGVLMTNLSVNAKRKYT